MNHTADIFNNRCKLPQTHKREKNLLNGTSKSSKIKGTAHTIQNSLQYVNV